MDTFLLLVLSQIRGIGVAKLNKVITYSKENPNLKISISYNEVNDLFDELQSIRPKDFNQDMYEVAERKASSIYEKEKLLGINIISPLDSSFPSYLKLMDIKQRPPAILHYKGEISCLNGLTIGVIGTRDNSPHAALMGPPLVKYFCDNSFTIVSGLAKGCDTIGHAEAVKNRKPTAAFLSAGLDDIYPKENQVLSNQILDTGGVLVSEYEIGRPMNKSYFVERDRLQSGASLGLIVLESGIKSGTMHAVNACKDQKKPIGCLYTHELEKYNLGSHEKFQGNKFIVNNLGGVKLIDRESIEKFITQVKDSKEILDGVLPQSQKQQLDLEF